MPRCETTAWRTTLLGLAPIAVLYPLVAVEGVVAVLLVGVRPLLYRLRGGRASLPCACQGSVKNTDPAGTFSARPSTIQRGLPSET
ncbi:MAG: hypothetical protein ISS31_05555 [Kiritimatiellae bacterium]|nr:hypothetical protein [Kiritimatiellia bacterium]